MYDFVGNPGRVDRRSMQMGHLTLWGRLDVHPARPVRASRVDFASPLLISYYIRPTPDRVIGFNIVGFEVLPSTSEW